MIRLFAGHQGRSSRALFRLVRTVPAPEKGNIVEIPPHYGQLRYRLRTPRQCRPDAPVDSYRATDGASACELRDWEPVNSIGGFLVAPLVNLPREEISKLCRRYGVKRLAVFGSATTDRFDPARSDVDFFLEFLDETKASFATYYSLKTALEELLGRSVDLVMSKALQNPYFAASALATQQELYAA